VSSVDGLTPLKLELVPGGLSFVLVLLYQPTAWPGI
jgi:hypothetical protein